MSKYELRRNTLKGGDVIESEVGEFYSLYFRNKKGLAMWILDIYPEEQR